MFKKRSHVNLKTLIAQRDSLDNLDNLDNLEFIGVAKMVKGTFNCTSLTSSHDSMLVEVGTWQSDSASLSLCLHHLHLRRLAP